MKKILLLIICTFTTSLSWGDSPLTYTEFHKAYTDVPICTGIDNDHLARFVYKLKLLHRHMAHSKEKHPKKC